MTRPDFRFSVSLLRARQDSNLRPTAPESAKGSDEVPNTPNLSGETVYSEAGKSPVPALSQTAPSAVSIRAELERATAAGDWARVAELARLLAAHMAKQKI